MNMTENNKSEIDKSEIDEKTVRELLAAAENAAEMAYAPYSQFHVGAAVLLADGGIKSGCNIENASYGATVCAERVAIWSAVAEGRLSPEKPPQAMAVTALPCAMCLQVMSEFAAADMPVFLPGSAVKSAAGIAVDKEQDGDLGRESGDICVLRLSELLPHAFRLR